MRAAGKLSSRDRRLIDSVQLTPIEQEVSDNHEISLQNLNMLEQAIDSTNDPKIIRLLSEERSNLIHLLEERGSLDSQEVKKQETNPESNALQSLLEMIQSLWK